MKKDKFTTAEKSIIIMAILSFLMIIASFILPPTGKIDNSVLAAGGLMLGYAVVITFLEAVKSGYDATFKHGETEIHIDNDNEEENKK